MSLPFPLLTEVLLNRYDREEGAAPEEGYLWDVFHYADWGALATIYSALQGVMAAHPDVEGVISVLEHRPNGKVLVFITISNNEVISWDAVREREDRPTT